jgi:hypothetical protein
MVVAVRSGTGCADARPIAGSSVLHVSGDTSTDSTTHDQKGTCPGIPPCELVVTTELRQRRLSEFLLNTHENNIFADFVVAPSGHQQHAELPPRRVNRIHA